MKTFTRFRTPKELKAACAKRGFRYDQARFDAGSDHVSFDFIHEGITARVCMSMVNGRAFGEFWKGKAGKKRRFSTDSTEHDALPWFQALLEFIYV